VVVFCRYDYRTADEASEARVSVVTEAIVDAIINKFHRTRYPVASTGGMPIWAATWVDWVLPDRATDFVIEHVDVVARLCRLLLGFL
jgi:hypothetical protein